MEIRICRICQEIKDITDFYKRENNKRRTECKMCQKKRVSKWARDRYKNNPEVKKRIIKYYEDNKELRLKQIKKWAKNNPEKRRRYNVSWRWKLRMDIIKAYGGKCACCGESIPEFLTIDHIANDGNKHREKDKTMQGGGLYRWLKKNNYPKDNYQLLCCNCNFAKGHFGGCPHND